MVATHSITYSILSEVGNFAQKITTKTHTLKKHL